MLQIPFYKAMMVLKRDFQPNDKQVCLTLKAEKP
jgi:hypothetical protein